MSDFRATSLPQIRAQFNAIMQRKIRPPAEQYRDESEDEKPTPRLEGDYRLPPLSFGESTPQQPHHSDQSVPRSLTPITERTDVASRQNSQRTAKSDFFGTSSNRQVSGGSQKQSSGGSTKHPSGDQTDRLATIDDSETAPGHLTEEPEQVSPAKQTLPSVPSPPPPGQTRAPQGITAQVHTPATGITSATATTGTTAPTPTFTTPTTVESMTGGTIWSQDSATPTPQQSKPSSPHPLHHVPAVIPIPVGGGAGAGTGTKDLPDLPVTSPASKPTLPEATPLPVPSQPSPEVISPTPRRVASGGNLKDGSIDLHEEPAAKYLMTMVEEPVQGLSPPPVQAAKLSTRKSPSPERPRIVTSFEQQQQQQQQQPHQQHHRTNETLGRKPSGARALPPKRGSTGPRLEAIPAEVETDASQSQSQSQSSTHPHTRDTTSATTASTQPDLGEDAAAFMSYAEQPSPEKAKAAALPIAPAPPAVAPEEEIRSSFAPSKAAAERRAKAEAAAVESQRAMSMPGGGKRVTSMAGKTGHWSGSDEDEDEEEQEEQDSPVVGQPRVLPQPSHASETSAAQNQLPAVERSASRTRALPAIPRAPEQPQRMSNGYGYDRGSHPLPQPHAQPYIDRPRTQSPAAPPRQQPPPGPSYGFGPGQALAHAPSAPPVPTSRTTVWNANFSAEHGMPEQSKSGKFVDLDEPQAHLTKAFAPHGLLQAGMQDKEDRSAKKQEEQARETGSSLINVPSKPPPPQTGLLGAVAAHENERKNPGGIGATLTDREREKRLAVGRNNDASVLVEVKC